MQPQVTVLTTVYNGLPYLRECIESILSQTLGDFEFLIIDDASTDESLECIRSYRDPRIRILTNEKNMGQVPSLNKGLRCAAGAFIARLDQDDVSLPTRLAEQLEYLKERPDLAIVCSYEHTIDSAGKFVRSWKRKLRDYGEFLAYIVLGLCPVWHPSVMFRKDVVLQLGGYDTSYAPAEDYELWSRIALNRFNAAVVPRFHLLQRVHDQKQSQLQGARQKQCADRAHEKIIGTFVRGGNVACLAAFLRLDNDPCGRSYCKDHVKELAIQLSDMLHDTARALSLTPDEARSLRKKIFARLGLGARYAPALAHLPDALFRPVFFGLSPLLLSDVRAWVSSVNNNLQKLPRILRP